VSIFGNRLFAELAKVRSQEEEWVLNSFDCHPSKKTMRRHKQGQEGEAGKDGSNGANRAGRSPGPVPKLLPKAWPWPYIDFRFSSSELLGNKLFLLSHAPCGTLLQQFQVPNTGKMCKATWP
jgi:hypothetical protein